MQEAVGSRIAILFIFEKKNCHWIMEKNKCIILIFPDSIEDCVEYWEVSIKQFVVTNPTWNKPHIRRKLLEKAPNIKAWISYCISGLGLQWCIVFSVPKAPPNSVH